MCQAAGDDTDGPQLRLEVAGGVQKSRIRANFTIPPTSSLIGLIFTVGHHFFLDSSSLLLLFFFILTNESTNGQRMHGLTLGA